ncbi:MAG: c-type cytochrome [Campylobacterota bacterium]|nr:c-type cytochrome [Campylobacterota bacterium]
MKKELQIFAVVVFFTAILYIGVEPFAHGQMHKHVDGENFAYTELKANGKQGNVENGKALVMGAGACTGCHGIEVVGHKAPMDATIAVGAYGVNPPDLSSAGAIYDAKFLANLIENPAHALKVEHKFDPAKGKMHPMTGFYGAGGDKAQEIADMVAYLQSIAPKEITPKRAYMDACGRCHANRYGKIDQLGETPKFKKETDALKHKVAVLEYQDKLKAYMGKLPPDLSIIIRARSEHFLETFVENPQSHLEGTSMPRVGLTPEGWDKVKAYLTETGDPSKKHREAIGPWVLLFTVVFTILAYLWKKQEWRDH